MSTSEIICPWIVPRAPKRLLALFDLKIEPGLFRTRGFIQTESEKPLCVRRIESGLVSQGVTNYRLNKPLAMNLYPAGSIQGIINLFTSEAAPRVVRAVKPTRLKSLPRPNFREALLNDQELFLEYVCYSEVVAKSELIGMEALFSLTLPERFLLFCAASLLHSGVNPLESSEDFLKLPMQLSRSTLLNIIYTTKAPLDRLLAATAREGTLERRDGLRFIRRKDLLLMSEWILSR